MDICQYQNNVRKESNMDYKYLKPLQECSDILSETDGVNYIILCADADAEEQDKVVGGSGWNIEDDSMPDFFTMVGGIIEKYLDENSDSFVDKMKLVKAFYEELMTHLTMKGEK